MTAPEAEPISVLNIAWADEPTTCAADDGLGRLQFAKMVARRIDESGLGRPSTVFGLVGTWGSGKSSLLNMIREELPKDEWAVVDFAPWSALDATSLTAEFLNTLGSAFGSGEVGESEPMRDAVLRYSRVAIPFLSMVPIVGNVLEGAVGAGVDLLAGRPSTPWHVAFVELAKKIAEQKKRVLIVADDIDRLDAEELMVLLRVIRLLGRFENVHYILAYDQDTIEGLLARNGVESRNASFMEKIVQYPFEVPPMAGVHKRRLLNETLRAHIRFSDESSPRITGDEAASRDRRALDLLTVLLDGLDTPRAFARFQQQLASYSDLLAFSELDVLDFIAVTYLRIFHHSLWTQLPRWKDELLAGTRSAGSGPGEGDDPTWATRIANAAEPSSHVAAVGTMSFLFEAVAAGRMSYFSKHDRAFGDAQYFERYLISGLADDDVSDALVFGAVADIITGTSSSAPALQLTEIIDGADADRAMLALEKCIRVRNGSDDGSSSLAAFLHLRLKAQGDDAPSSFDAPKGQLSRWAAREVLLCLQQGLLGAFDVIKEFGETQAFEFLFQGNAGALTRAFAKEAAPAFVDYVLERIRGDLLDVLADRPRLAAFIDLAVFAERQNDVTGILDELVNTDVELFTGCVESFGRVERWVGSSIVYALGFRSDLYELAFSEAARGALAPGIHLNRELAEIPNDDFEQIPPDQDVRDFARASAKALSALVAQES